MKIFGIALMMCDQYEQVHQKSTNLPNVLKELVQEKIKINLSLGDSRLSGEVKKILQTLNEF